MPVYLSIIILAGLFFVLGASANIVVTNIKKIAHTLGIPLFLLGIILGILTSFPELSLAVNASLNGITEVSIGNLFGGIFVVFGLVLGLALILNRKVKTDGDIRTPLPAFVLLTLPLLLGLDGTLGRIDGAIICLGYIAILIHLYFKNKNEHLLNITIVSKKTLLKQITLIILGTTLVIGASHFIIDITIQLLSIFNVSGFLVGLIVFSLGTNLPELTVVISSWIKKVKEIPFSHMLGSAIVNALILGLMALFGPLTFEINTSYKLILYFLLLMSVLLLYFYRSDKTLSRPEGIVLLTLFIVFGYLQTVVAN
jgi:cation:H+ antiporter